MGEFLMPSLGADMDSGTLVEWLVKPGDAVQKGDVVAVVDTTKAAIEVETFESGVITSLLVQPGTEVPVGTPLAVIGAAGAAPPSPRLPLMPPPTVRVAASPLARRRAAELNVELDAVTGTGPGGAVTVGDVLAVAHHARPLATRADGAVATAPHLTEPATRSVSRQDAVGELLARSKREIPHYYLSSTVDLATALEWLRDRNAAVSVAERVLPAALLLRATARAAHDVPGFNGWWRDGGYQPSDVVRLGVAVSLRDEGLVAPVIDRADELDLMTLMSALRDVVQRARTGRMRASTMTEPSITVTNLGDQGAESVYGVIYPPQVALVGFGKVAQGPIAIDGMLGVHPLVHVTLAADHRVSNGHRGSVFLAAIDHHLQQPESL